MQALLLLLAAAGALSPVTVHGQSSSYENSWTLYECIEDCVTAQEVSDSTGCCDSHVSWEDGMFIDTTLVSGNWLNLAQDEFLELPSELGLLSRLEKLYVSDEGLNVPKGLALGQELGYMTNLETLHLHCTMAADAQFPLAFWYNLPSLTELSLDGAAMSELGQGDLWSLLRGFPNLQILTLTDNYIATTLDLSALAESCPLLTELQLDGNAWTGDLSGVHDLTSLEYLNVERNTDTLTGTIPTEIAALTALTELRLGGNALTGTVPWSYLFNATMNLQVLTLGCVEVGGVDFCNNMSGQLPSNEELQNAMGKLEHLEARGMELNGSFPMYLYSFPYVDLANNTLDGPLPEVEIRSPGTMMSLQLEHNQLTGTIPHSLSQLTSLTVMNLAGNVLTGTLPASLAYLSESNGGSIQSMRLEQNFLCGSVPEALLNASQAIGDFQAMFPWSLPGCPCCTELEDNPLWCCARWTFANVPSGDPYNGGGLMELCNPDC